MTQAFLFTTGCAASSPHCSSRPFRPFFPRRRPPFPFWSISPVPTEPTPLRRLWFRRSTATTTAPPIKADEKRWHSIRCDLPRLVDHALQLLLPKQLRNWRCTQRTDASRRRRDVWTTGLSGLSTCQISATGETAGCGTIFQLGLDGELTTLYNFSGPDGANPGGLVQGTDGNLYGMTGAGGPNREASFPLGTGTVFKFVPGVA